MLEVKNLCKSYKTKEVLKGVNFNVKKGEIKGLVGVNGAGKTTLIELICRVKSADSGEIIINGIPLTDKKAKNDIKRTIGYMPQSLSLFNDLTVEENLGYLSEIYDMSKERVEETIKLCNLTEMRKKLAKNLSGGYKQLLSLAGAILHKPKFLILDEPTSAMDPIFRQNFWKIIHSCNEDGATVLVITHYMEELLECDNFACLSNGVIVYDGKVKDVAGDGLVDFAKLIEGKNNDKN